MVLSDHSYDNFLVSSNSFYLIIVICLYAVTWNEFSLIVMIILCQVIISI